jgi:CBS domain-containing protein
MMKRIPVTEFMRAELATASPDMSLAEFVAGLEEHSVRSMCVTDTKRVVVGVVSETDLFLKEKGVPFSMEKVPTLLGRVIGKGELERSDISTGVRVREIMTRDVVCADAGDTLEDVAWLMHRRKISLVPVVSDKKLIGEVRRIDVLRLIYGRS